MHRRYCDKSIVLVVVLNNSIAWSPLSTVPSGHRSNVLKLLHTSLIRMSAGTGVKVGVKVGVAVLVGVAVNVGVDVGVRVAVGVSVLVGVGVGVG